MQRLNKQSIFLLLATFIITLPALAVDPYLKLRASTPLIASAAGGLRFGDATESWQPAIEAEAGVGGGRIALGLDSLGSGKLGYGFKTAFLRSWIEPATIDENQSFLGLEGEISIERFVLNLGGYRRISSGDDDWVASAGLGFIF